MPELTADRKVNEAMGGTGANQALLLALGDSAVRHATASEGSVHWSLQHHDPDRDRWLEVGRFPSREVATMSLHALVAHGHGRMKDFRIRKVRISARA